MDKFDAYCNSLKLLCDAHNLLCRMMAGQPTKKEAYLGVVWFDTCKEKFLVASNELGYKDGIDFMCQELPFDGCKIIEGKLYGDTKKAYTIAGNWQRYFSKDTTSNFKYEIGVFLESLADLRTEQEVLV